VDKVIFNDGEEAKQEDYNDLQHLTEKALQDVLYEAWGSPSSGFLGNGFKVTADSGMNVQMAVGTGFYYDSSESDADRAKWKPLRNASIRSITVPTADATHHRKDIVCVAPARALGTPEDRLYMDETTQAITTEILNKRDRSSYAYSYVAGTPAGSPSEPAVPAGYTKVTTIDVAAGTATISNGNITDGRNVLPTIQDPGSAVDLSNVTPRKVAFSANGGTKVAMPAVRTQVAAATNGTTIYVVGGADSAGTPQNSLYAFDTVANTVATKATMTTARYSPGAAIVAGVLYVIGGTPASGYSNKTEAYNIAGNSWSGKTDWPVSATGPVVATDGTTVFAASGFGGTYSTRLDAYDPVTNTWSSKAAITTARSSGAGAIVNGVLYVSGGSTGSATTANEAYNIAGNSWSTKTALPSTRMLHGAAAIGSTIYAVGGNVAGSSASASMDSYDTVANTWTSRTAMPTGRNAPGVAAASNVLHVIGGGNSSNVAQTVHEAYDPPTNVSATALSPGTAISASSGTLANTTKGITGAAIGFDTGDVYGANSGGGWVAGGATAIVTGGL
jgi:hypothetical protein